MMFSSRRSRNRHSANPNPKLHTPHLRRKISPHDGRSHQGPHFLGNLLAGGGGPGGPPPPPVSPPTSSSGAGPKFPGVLPGGLGANFAAAAAAGAIPPHLLSPELIQRQKMELARLHESMQFGGAFGGAGMDPMSDAKRPRLSGDSQDENGLDMDEKSTSDMDGAQSTNDGAGDEAASSNGNTSVAGGGGGGGRKRKSQNPTRINTDSTHKDDETHINVDKNTGKLFIIVFTK